MTRKTTFSYRLLCLKISLTVCFLLSCFSSFAQQWDILGNEQAISSVASSHTSIAVVKNGNNFIPYVVFTEAGVPKVKKRLTNGSWEQVGADLATNASHTRIYANAIGDLYVTYIDLSADSKLAVKKHDFTNGTWNSLNPEDNNTLYISTGNANGMNAVGQYGSTQRCSMAFDSFNVPYIAFSESGMVPYVKKFNETAWETVGTGAVSGELAAAVGLAIDSSDKPWLVYSKLAATNSTTGNMVLYNFNGNTWDLITNNPIPTIGVRHTNIAIRDNNNICIAYFNTGSSNRATAILYNKSTNEWGTPTTLASRDSPNISLINDNSGNLYCSFIDYTASATVFPTRVRFLASGSTTWTELKDPAVIRGIDEPTGWPAIAIGSAPYPYVVYTKANSNGVNTPIVRMYIPPPPPAELTTNNITNITTTTAVSGGNITSDGGQPITERGVVYSNSNPNPTTADTKVADVTGGIGNFSVTLTGLISGTFYYARAYAINGGSASYGNTVRLSTLQIPDAVVSTPKQVEFLDRGLIAVQKTSGTVFLSWRLLGDDPSNIAFDVYRNGVKINTSPITNATNYTDGTTTNNNVYSVKPIINGVEGTETTPVTVWAKNQLEVPIQMPPGGTVPDGRAYTYTANDASVGDVDGDGVYEIILKWQPTLVNDNAGGYSGKEIFDCYKLDGTRLWRIDLGINVNAGPHYNQFMVYDFDGDGKAEIILKTADGTIDGLGNVIGNASVDYRNTSGWVQQGPEFLTVFNGLTGAAMATVPYQPARDNVADWGDNYGNRQDRFVSAVAYLDGARPSLVVGRGYYNRLVRTAYNWRNGQLTLLWKFDSKDPAHPEYNAYSGQGNHQMTIGDIDGDGKDEIINGSSAINDDGKPLWTYKMGHGDALHMTDMDLDRPGQEIWICLESPGEYDGMGLRQYDAKTGETNWGIPTTGDVGRAMAADLDPNYKGYEMWGSAGGSVYDAKGNAISSSVPSYNSGIWWDGDLGRELLDRTYIDKWNPTTKSAGRLFTIYQAAPISSNNSTKSNPALQVDLFGDWREEVIFRKSDDTALVIFTTDLASNYRIPTLMHDPQYRTAIAWQNSGYNQPPYTSYYIGYDMDVNNIPTAKIAIAGQSTVGITAITRKTPTTASTNANSVVYNLAFSANVTGVDSSDFTLTATGTATGTIASITALTAASYDVTVNNISGDGTLRLDVNASGTEINDESGTTIISKFTSGESYTFDHTAPTLSSVVIVSNNTNTTLAKTGDTVTLNFTASENITNLELSIAGHTITTTDLGSNNYSATYQLTNTDTEGVIPFVIQFKDLAGNTGTAVSTTSDAKTVTFDRTVPTLPTLTFTSNNANNSIAKEGDVVTLNFTTSETVKTPTITIAGQSVTVNTITTNSFSATHTMQTTDIAGIIPFTIDISDLAGNAAPQITTAATTVKFNHTAPIIKVYVETPSCPGKANGKINIATNMNTYLYTIAIKGNGIDQSSQNVEITTTKNWERENLAAGTYQITVAIPSIAFEQSFGVVVNEIGAITAKRVEINKTVNYTVSGSKEYIVTVNGVSKNYTTTTNETSKIEIDADLLQETNNVTIATNNDCQETVEDQFIMSPIITVNPNPTSDIITINNVSKALVQVYTNTGALIIETHVENGKSIDLKGNSAGMYLVKITQGTTVETFKVILK
ncbi:T9SS type A sorting domain-containing protein [Flavobacterium sp. FBOR7N2.3]|uniref:T9SS type A sorting domain-containing protein n=1 Tax=Flavobacterium magnesitis TaxID=3138077 RepID=A0ABV4TJI4_9FLAO